MMSNGARWAITILLTPVVTAAVAVGAAAFIEHGSPFRLPPGSTIEVITVTPPAHAVPGPYTGAADDAVPVDGVAQ